MGIASPPFHTGETTPELVGHPTRIFIPVGPDPGLTGIRLPAFFHTGAVTPPLVQHSAMPPSMATAPSVGNI